MVQKNHAWDEVFDSGNPICSTAVNKCINDVQKFEVCIEGVVPNTMRPLECKEFLLIIKMAKLCKVGASDTEANKSVFMSSLLSMQCHMICRVDDMLQSKNSDFYANFN